MLYSILMVVLIIAVIVVIVKLPEEMIINRSGICCITVSAVALFCNLVNIMLPMLSAMCIPTVLIIPVPTIQQQLFYSVNILIGILIIKTSKKRNSLIFLALTTFIDIFFVGFNAYTYTSIVSVLLLLAIFSCLAGIIKKLKYIWGH